MKSILVSIFTLCIITVSNAQQNKKEKDIEAIKTMSGCYEVAFNFIETFNYSKDPSYLPSKEKHDNALEWVEIIHSKKNEIQLQHLLIVGNPNKPHIVKHWRQDWLYENQDLYFYQKDNHWKYTQLPSSQVKGQWTQKVYQVDDSPRYEGSATWVHIDGKSYWENTTAAPLPRREHTKRNDYNITLRKNRQELVKGGWIHDQYNYKIIRKDGSSDVVLAEEKGYNTYKKVANEKCFAAQNWWNDNQGLWKKVRGQWTKIFKNKEDIILRKEIDNKALHSRVFELKNTASSKDISSLLEQYLK